MKRPPRFISNLDNNFGLGQDWPSRLRFQDSMVNNRGEVVVHETAIACPKCRGREARDIVGKISTCENCEGGGFIYVKPRYIMSLITGISSQRMLQDFGFAMPGDCMMSISPFLAPSVTDFDKVTFTFSMPIDDGEVILRGSWHERAPDFYKENEDKIAYDGEELIHCEDEDRIEYFMDDDFIFDKKKVIWIGAKKPKIRSRYTIKYKAFMEWIVFQPPVVRIDVGRDLGNRVLLRKRHVAFMQHDKAHQPPAILKASLNFGGEMKV